MTKKKSSKKIVKVYSYIRFSSPEQALGDSEKRQLEKAQEWADKNGYILDDEYNLIDRGKSGFHGDHIKEGAFGVFLKLLEVGEIESGSILLIENVDRLGREDPTKALNIVTSILLNGVTIQTLGDFENVYTRESVNKGFIWKLLGEIERAHGESKRKSEFGRDNWERKRNRALEDGEVLTKRVPAWLKVTGEKKEKQIVEIKEAVESIKMIFELRSEGHGPTVIAKLMNKNSVWTPPKQRTSQKGFGWGMSYVKKILENRAVMGEYQPHKKRNGKRFPDGDPIPNYFPQIISPDLFHNVQQVTKSNGRNGGRNGKFNNILSKLVDCAYCGGSMHFDDKGSTSKGGKYLVCYNKKRGAVDCSAERIRYEECKDLVLANCKKLKPQQVLPNPNTNAEKCKQLKKQIAGIAGIISDNEEKQQNLFDQIEDSKVKSIRDKYEQRIVELDEENRSNNIKKENLEQELSKLEKDQKAFKKWQASFSALTKAIEGDEPELREKLNYHLKEFIEKIEIFSHGYPQDFDGDYEYADKKTKNGKNRRVRRKGDTFAEKMMDLATDNFPDLLTNKRFWNFVEEVAERRKTKEGRFIRLHFKSGTRFDLVPPGSLASGQELIKEDNRFSCGVRFVEPNLDQLWQEIAATA